MDSNKIWLSSPHMGGTERNYVTEAFDTNWVAPLGPNVNGFEQDISNYIGFKNQFHTAARTSGTAALHLALLMLNVAKDDVVIGDYCTVNPGARVSGSVKIGELSSIGVGAILNNNILIASEVKVGAGAVVLKSVEKKSTVFGNPARIIFNN
jgi:acetyltransferase-like isoleucine patch superfamily enzyme